MNFDTEPHSADQSVPGPSRWNVQPSTSRRKPVYMDLSPEAEPTVPSWHGIFTWGRLEPGTNALTVMQARMMAQPTHGGERMHPESWPPVLSVALYRQPGVPEGVLQDWMKRYGPVTILLRSEITDDLETAKTYRTVVQYLETTNQYACASWNDNSGVYADRLLIFPLKGKWLAGAYFPDSGGVPALPRPEICGLELASIPLPFAIMLAKMSPSLQQTLAQLPHDQVLSLLQGLVSRQRELSHYRQLLPLSPPVQHLRSATALRENGVNTLFSNVTTCVQHDRAIHTPIIDIETTSPPSIIPQSTSTSHQASHVSEPIFYLPSLAPSLALYPNGNATVPYTRRSTNAISVLGQLPVTNGIVMMAIPADVYADAMARGHV